MANTLTNELKETLFGRGMATPQLVMINVAVFLILMPLELFQFFGDVPEINRISVYLAVRAGVLETLLQPWSYITYMFVHLDFPHLLGNMLGLYFLGRILEPYIGRRKLIALYVLGALAGAVLYQLSYGLLHLAYPMNPRFLPIGTLIGASAGVLAIIVAAGTLLPNQYVNLFLIGPVKLKWVAAIAFAISIVVDFVGNLGGNLAHIGGGVLGFFFIRLDQQGRDLGRPVYWVLDRLSGKRSGSGSGRMRATHVNPERPPRNDYDYNAQKAVSQRRTDEILDKISKSGYDSLSKEEKEYLFHISNKK